MHGYNEYGPCEHEQSGVSRCNEKLGAMWVGILRGVWIAKEARSMKGVWGINV